MSNTLAITWSDGRVPTKASSTNTSTTIDTRHTSPGGSETPSLVSSPEADEKTPQNAVDTANKGTPGRRHACKGCDTTWTGYTICHCSGCHQTFAGITLFDRHRSPEGEHGSCKEPATITTRKGDLVMFLVDGVWRSPAMTAEQLQKIRGIK